jgi:hypothetical protein
LGGRDNPNEVRPQSIFGIFQGAFEMKTSKYREIEKHYQEIKIHRSQGISWRDICEELRSKHHLNINYSYLRKTWTDLEAKEASPEDQAAFQEKVKALMDIQPINANEKEELERYKRLAEKRERLLQEAQSRLRVLEAQIKKFVEELENGRRGMSKFLYRQLMAIATGKIVRSKKSWP